MMLSGLLQPYCQGLSASRRDGGAYLALEQAPMVEIGWLELLSLEEGLGGCPGGTSYGNQVSASLGQLCSQPWLTPRTKPLRFGNPGAQEAGARTLLLLAKRGFCPVTLEGTVAKSPGHLVWPTKKPGDSRGTLERFGCPWCWRRGAVPPGPSCVLLSCRAHLAPTLPSRTHMSDGQGLVFRPHFSSCSLVPDAC